MAPPEFKMTAAPAPDRPLTLAFVMDPVEAEPMEGSTTIVMMREAQERGHIVLYVDPDDLEVDAGRVRAKAVPIELGDGASSTVQRGKARIYDFDHEIDVAFQRKDPPVDRDFIVATQILDICSQTIVLNRPISVIAVNEKLLVVPSSAAMRGVFISAWISALDRARLKIRISSISPS